jgi:arabinan endo-1,5-alpha-L-arabinosidase
MKTLWLILLMALGSAVAARAQMPRWAAARTDLHTFKLAEERMRDACVLPDKEAGVYYLYTSSGRRGPNNRSAVVAYKSRDLETWEGPHVVFEVPADFWAQRGIWAPEVHAYKGKYYLFTTFNTDDKFPEQWRDWLPRVKRGSQVLVADSALGPFKAFQNRAHTPADMMTLDGTLWVEDGVPYMVFCHEWVQIKDGTVEFLRLKDDLSDIDGEPVRLFHGSDAPWSVKSEKYGCHVTDGPWLHRSQSGRLFMLWSSGGAHGYTTGCAISRSGKLAGPWEQTTEPLFGADGGHAMMFRRFDGQLMLALHQPNDGPRERIRLLEVEDTGEALILKNP